MLKKRLVLFVNIIGTSTFEELGRSFTYNKNSKVYNILVNKNSSLSAYKVSYSTQHVLLHLVKEWKTNLDNNFVVATVLMDLSKAFHCIPQTF